MYLFRNRSSLELTKDSCKKDGKVRAGGICRWSRVGDVGNIVLKDRRNLGKMVW